MARSRKQSIVAAEGSKARRQRSKRELRQQILDAARSLFVEEGYDAVSMRKVATRINYTPTTIYLHFKDKDDLCTALCEEDWLTFGQVFGNLLAIRHPVKRLLRAGAAYISFGFGYPQHYRWLFLTPRANGDTGSALIKRGDPTVDAYAFLRQTVADCIEGGYFKSEFRNIELAAQMIWASVHGVVALHTIKPGADWIKWVSPKRLAQCQLGLVQALLIDEDGHGRRRSSEASKKKGRLVHD